MFLKLTFMTPVYWFLMCLMTTLYKFDSHAWPNMGTCSVFILTNYSILHIGHHQITKFYKIYVIKDGIAFIRILMFLSGRFVLLEGISSHPFITFLFVLYKADPYHESRKGYARSHFKLCKWSYHLTKSV